MALSPDLGHLVPTPRLDALVDEVEGLAARVADARADDRASLRERRLRGAATATLALDGAVTNELPELDTARRLVDADAPDLDLSAGPRAGTWLDTLGASPDPPSDDLVRALELLGAVAGLSADDLAGQLAGPGGLDALRELHGRVTRGLVAADAAGAARTTDQAVHDTSIGRIVYLPVPIPRIPEELGRLGAWLDTSAGTAHPVVASGILHAELLRIHPFEAANGRVARTAARLLLRAGGADPDGLSGVELELARDPMGYHQAMADTIRRRDLAPWVERWAEAVAAGLRDALRDLGLATDAVPARAARFAAERATPAFTLVDYLEVVDHDRDEAEADLRTLLDAGVVERVLGSRGLRYRLVQDRSTGPEADQADARSSGGSPSSQDTTTSR